MIIRLKYEAGYQGYVDIDVLLSSGKVFSYYYAYGSCSECDEWENRNLSDDEILLAMQKECSFIDYKNYYLFRKDK